MSPYFKELSWQFDFSLTINAIIEVSHDQQHNINLTSAYCRIPPERLVTIYPFSKIQTIANEHGLSIINSIHRKQLGHRGNFSIIHTDSINIFNNADPSAVPFALNIPLHGVDSAITRWYDFSNNPYLKDEDTRFPILNREKFTAFTPDHISEFLKCCVAEYTMTRPAIINTAIPHNVDDRLAPKLREILSIWFLDVATQKLATWEQSTFLENIIFD